MPHCTQIQIPYYTHKKRNTLTIQFCLFHFADLKATNDLILLQFTQIQTSIWEHLKKAVGRWDLQIEPELFLEILMQKFDKGVVRGRRSSPVKSETDFGEVITYFFFLSPLKSTNPYIFTERV